jgi:hypothetical protein
VRSKLRDLVKIVRDLDFKEGNRNAHAQYVIEKEFVDK